MKQLFTGVALYCFSLTFSLAQLNERFILTWTDGKILFQTGDSIQCKLRYNQAASSGVLQVLENDITVTLSPTDVSSFSFFDKSKERIRTFSSMPVNDKGENQQFYFMEKLYANNRFAILNYRTMDVPVSYMNYTRLISKPVRMNKKFILDNSTGKMIPLSKENVLRLMENKRNEVIGYIENRHLKFKKTADFIHLFEYHRSL